MKLKKGIDYERLTYWSHWALRKRGYKYRLLRKQRIVTDIQPEERLVGSNHWVTLNKNGSMVLLPSYCCDGPSGPTWDTATTIRAAFFHDAFYQLIREGKLFMDIRLRADDVLYRLMREDGAWVWRARVWVWAVKNFAQRAAVA